MMIPRYVIMFNLEDVQQYLLDTPVPVPHVVGLKNMISNTLANNYLDADLNNYRIKSQYFDQIPGWRFYLVHREHTHHPEDDFAEIPLTYFHAPNRTPLESLAELIPDLIRFTRTCPEQCNEETHITVGNIVTEFPRKQRKLGDLVVHLNDIHHWAREDIADWFGKPGHRPVLPHLRSRMNPMDNPFDPAYPPPLSATDSMISVMCDLIPNLARFVTYPSHECLSATCEIKRRNGLTREGSLLVIIIHLNDDAGWTREEVADWLETLDLDICFRMHEIEVCIEMSDT